MNKINTRASARMLAIAGLLACAATTAAPGGITNALEGARLGLDYGTDYRLIEGKCDNCATPPPALWYFRSDVVAVPREVKFDPKLPAQEDVRTWAYAHPAGENLK